MNQELIDTLFTVLNTENGVYRSIVECAPVNDPDIIPNPQVETLINEVFQELVQSQESSGKNITEEMIRLEVRIKIKNAYDEANKYLNNRSIKVKKEYSLE